MLDRAALVDVLEKIIDAVLLHKTADEIEIRLPVLGTMVHFPVRFFQVGSDVVKTVVLEDFLYDARHGHFFRRVSHARVENSAVSSSREKPQPRHDGCLVTV